MITLTIMDHDGLRTAPDIGFVSAFLCGKIQKSSQILHILSKVWVMMSLKSHGLWDITGLWDFSGNQVGGHTKPMGYYRLWGIRGMG